MSKVASKTATALVETKEKEKEEEVEKAVIIDHGSDSIRIGIAGDDYPRSILFNKGSFISAERDIIDNNYKKKKGIVSLKYPIEDGIVKNWDDMEKIWHHSFYNELRIQSHDQKVLLSSFSGSNSCNDIYKMTELMFEKFDVGAIFIGQQATLSLYASGKTTGIILDCGFGNTHVIPIVEGEILSNAILGIDLAGNNITKYLMQMLYKRGYNFFSKSSYRARTIARDIKEKHGYVLKDFETEMINNIEKNYALPDGQVISIGDELFRCPEVLFKPSLIDKEYDGIHKLTYDCIMKCDVDIRKELLKSIILSGGTTMFPGLKQRLKNEIELLCPSGVENVNIIALPERDVGAFVGGSILCSLSCFGKQWITKDEYDERVCRQPLRRNCTSIRYSNGNGGDNGNDIILKGNVSATRCIY